VAVRDILSGEKKNFDETIKAVPADNQSSDPETHPHILARLLLNLEG